MPKILELWADLWDLLVRWRTWVVNAALTVALILPELLNSPEILAIVPGEYQRWVLVAAFLVNIWMRPRPAVRADDLEASVSRSRN